MFDVIMKFGEIRKMDRALYLRNFDLIPDVTSLLTFERKYGDGITYEDIHGFKKRNTKRRVRDSSQLEGGV